MPTAYCEQCGWEHHEDEESIDELNRAMIDHHVETGHSPVEQRDANDDRRIHGELEVQ